MEKLTFIQCNNGLSANATQLRVSSELAKRVKELSSLTGFSIYEMTCRLLQFALDNVEIMEDVNA